MKDTNEILTKIAQVTREIENNHPELLKYLDETRSTIPTKSNAKLDASDLKNYLNQLQEMLAKYKAK